MVVLEDSRLYDEPARLAALRRYQVLDTQPEAAFEAIVAEVRAALSVPIAAVSLIDEHRQWFKAQSGLAVCETPRSISFCTHTIQARAPLIIHDARADTRFACNPLVTGDPFIAAYAGMPLASPDGYVIGSLCAIDTTPRSFSLAQIDMLRGLARRVLEELQFRQRTQRDELTGLQTRAAMFVLAALEVARRDRHGRDAAMLMVDVDRLFLLNQALGHAEADLVLRTVANAASAALRPGDHIGRVGGDEFMILLPETAPSEAAAVAETVRQAVAGLVHPGAAGGVVTVSIGVAPLTDHIRSVDAWSSAADQLLRVAKQSGRNRCQQGRNRASDRNAPPHERRLRA